MSKRPGVKFIVNAAFFREIKEDHAHLKTILDRLRTLAAHPPAIENHRREFSDLLSELADQLALHFSLEEAYGYFEDAVDIAPWLHEEAGTLIQQHRDLYSAVVMLSEKAVCELEAEESNFVGLLEHFDQFDTNLKLHEAAESRLIIDALNRDVGVGD